MIKDKNKLFVYLDLVSGCNLAKLGDGPNKSPTVMVGQQTKQKPWLKIGAYLNPVGLSLRQKVGCGSSIFKVILEGYANHLC